MDDKYDSALLGILQHEGKIERFLNAMFGFLYRRTDFYRIMTRKEDRLGFPPGRAKMMLDAIFQQYDELTRRDDQVREAQLEAIKQKQVEKDIKSKESPASTATSAASDPSYSDKTTSSKHQGTGPSQNSGSGDSEKPVETKSTEPSSDNNSAERTKGVVGKKATKESSSANRETSSSATDAGSKPQASGAKSPSGEEDDDPELTRQQQVFQSNPESYNGAVRENYSWAQSITDIDIRVKVPSYIKKGRDVKVDVAKKHVKVTHKDEQGQWKVVVDGDLTWEVDKEESMWTLNPGENVHINVEKREERWWDSLLTGEPKINVRKIDASRPMADLDDEAQAKIEEMMYNDRRKKMGLPTAQEEKMQDMLKNAWNAEGSPFKGQAFDPSKFSMDPSTGVVNMKPS